MRYPLFLGSGERRGADRVGSRLAPAALVLVVLTLPVVYGCGGGGAKPGEGAAGPVTVTALTVTPRDVPIAFEYVAQTQSSRQVNIQARVSGFLEKRVYTEGGVVKEGQVLFLMDAKPFETQVDAQAAALQRQMAGLEVARSDLERTKPLAAQNALSQKDLDDANGQFLAASAAVEEAKARLETAKLNLSYCTIVSPVTGITGAALLQDGTYVNPLNSLLTTVAVLSPIWVNFSLSENEVLAFQEEIARGRLRAPKDGSYVVEVLLADGSLFPYTGRITFAAPSFNAETGTFLVRASVENPEGALRPNAYVRVRLKGAVRPDGILVPQRAVQQGSEGHFVWVVDEEGKARPRPVRVGRWHGDDWFITEGLRAGDRVIVDGSLAIRAGSPVQARAAEPATRAVAASTRSAGEGD